MSDPTDSVFIDIPTESAANGYNTKGDVNESFPMAAIEMFWGQLDQHGYLL